MVKRRRAMTDFQCTLGRFGDAKHTHAPISSWECEGSYVDHHCDETTFQIFISTSKHGCLLQALSCCTRGSLRSPATPCELPYLSVARRAQALLPAMRQCSRYCIWTRAQARGWYLAPDASEGGSAGSEAGEQWQGNVGCSIIAGDARGSASQGEEAGYRPAPSLDPSEIYRSYLDAFFQGGDLNLEDFDLGHAQDE